jgi:hypothetical protein
LVADSRISVRMFCTRPETCRLSLAMLTGYELVKSKM